MAQYNHLPVWQASYQLALDIYRATHQFPREYKYDLEVAMVALVRQLAD